jgi:hypothetical protein
MKKAMEDGNVNYPMENAQRLDITQIEQKPTSKRLDDLILDMTERKLVKMSKISARPWKIAHCRDATDSYRRYIEDNKGNRIASMYRKDFCDYCTCMPDADYIVKCVNEHDTLVHRVEIADAEILKIKRLLARAYLFADWKSAEVDKILDNFEKELKEAAKDEEN